MLSKPSPELRPNRYDVLVAALVLALAALVAVLFYGNLTGSGLAGSSPVTATVTHRGEVVATLPLTKDTELTVGEEYRLTVIVENGAVRVAESDCPTADCVRTGAVSRPGQSIVCLPEQVIIRLSGEKQPGDYDIILG